MSRFVQVETPEYVDIEFELSGIGSRFGAAVIDHLLIALILLSIWTVGYTIAITFGHVNIFGDSALWMQAVITLVSFICILAYYPFFELRNNGQSPGKKIFGLRVVRDGGLPINISSSLIRNILRIADLMPGAYGVGLVTVFFNKTNKRLGDISAGTMVIKDRVSGTNTSSVPPISEGGQLYMQYVVSVDSVLEFEWDVIKDFLSRRNEMPQEQAIAFAQYLSGPLFPKVGIQFQVSHPLHYVDIVEAIYYKRLTLEQPLDKTETFFN